jgi:hypothetical protein
MLISLDVVLLVVEVKAVRNIRLNVIQAQALYSLLDEVELVVLVLLDDEVELALLVVLVELDDAKWELISSSSREKHEF